jgi:predicted transcriptional regulator
MDYTKVKDKNYLLRNLETNAIINTDIKGYEEYESNYKRLFAQNQRISNLENNVNQIKDDLSEIKNLLRNLANGS